MRAEDLLAESAWLRRLAARLSGADGADDLVQETYEAALRRPPDTSRPLRPWLAKVLRDAWRMRARGAGRRTAREQDWRGEDVPTPEALVERAEAQRMLVDRVLALREPYRGTVLLCFHEGLTAAEVARTQGIPAGTVRWRLKVALDELRAGLGERDRRWMIALMALPKGALIVNHSIKAATKPILLVAILLLLVGAFVALRGRTPAPEAERPPAAAAAPTRAALAPAPPETTYATQPGVTPRRISGTVVHRGQPVAGAEVTLSDWTYADRVVTDERGAFAFTPRRAWAFVLMATATGRTAASLRVDNRDPTARLEGIVLELGGCETTVTGALLDAAGTPLGGARVRHLAGAPDVPGPWGPAVITDAQGRYEICLPRGRRYLRIEADGYGTLFGVVDALGRRRMNLTLAPEGTVIGRAVDAASGEGLGGVLVKLWPVTRGQGSPDIVSGTADETGAFQIGGAAAGRYYVQAWAAEHVVREPLEIVVEAAQVTGPILVRMAASARVGGVVREHGRPIAGAEVTLFSPVPGVGQGLGVQERSFRTVTAADGSFSAHGAPRGVTVKVEVALWEVLSPQKLTLLERETRDVVIEVAGLGSIAGTVTRGGAPAAGANVFALPEPSPRGTSIRRATSDAGGAFVLAGLTAATYHVWADTADSFTKEQPRIPLGDRERKAGVILVLDGTVRIAGVVVDKAGKPVEGAEIRVARTAGDDVGSSITTLDGSWEIPQLTGGTYRVDVRPWRGAPRSFAGPFADLEVAGDLDGVRLVVERQERTIAGKVVDGGGAGVPDALVRAATMTGGAAPDFTPWTPWPSVHTDEDGAFELTVPDDGTYAVQAQLGTQAPAVKSGVRGGATGVVLQLVVPGAIEGQLSGLPATAIWARREGGGSFPTASLLAHPDGDHFRFTGVAPGSYVVSATAPDGRAAAETVTVEAGKTTMVKLASTGTGRLRGRVVSFTDGSPVAGVTCLAGAAAGDVIPAAGGWNPPATAVSGEDGRFEVTPAPNGDVLVMCTGDRHHKLSDGLARGRLPADGETVVPIIRRVTEGPIGTVGLTLQPFALLPRVLEVSGAAAAAGVLAGDVVVAVDGRPVAGLAPDGVLTLIGDRPPGAPVAVSFAGGGVKTMVVVTPF